MTVTFGDKRGNTLLTITTVLDSPATAQAFRGMGIVEGWGMSLDRLDLVVTASAHSE